MELLAVLATTEHFVDFIYRFRSQPIEMGQLWIVRMCLCFQVGILTLTGVSIYVYNSELECTITFSTIGRWDLGLIPRALYHKAVSEMM